MAGTKAITLRLDEADYERLAAEAERLGMRPGTLARAYLRADLGSVPETEAERRRRVGLAALKRLRELTADLPPVDALAILRESREELERRPEALWPSS